MVDRMAACRHNIHMPSAGERTLSRAELVEVYEILKLLGPMAVARTAMLASREWMLEAVDLVARMRTEDAAQRWADYNFRFHRLIEDVGSGPRTVAILGELRGLAMAHTAEAILAHAGWTPNANAEHEEILRAIIAGDAQAAADATLHHLDSSLRRMLTVHPVSPVPTAGCLASHPAAHLPDR
jgi:GntR family transcriptional regulator, transcriptional repressor for pyruvate dehydrogenase complex